MRGITRLIVICAAVVVSSSSFAWAQDPPAKPGAERKGFLIGFTFGGGTAACGTCDTKGAGAASVHIGGMVTSNASH